MTAQRVWGNGEQGSMSMLGAPFSKGFALVALNSFSFQKLKGSGDGGGSQSSGAPIPC